MNIPLRYITALGKIADQREPSERYPAIGCIHLVGDRIEATDTRQLVRMLLREKTPHEVLFPPPPNPPPPDVDGDVEMSVGNGVVTLCANEIETRFPCEDGRYPDTADVFPKGAPKAAIRMNAKMLAETLLTMIEASGAQRAEDMHVDIEVRENTQPVTLTMEDAAPGRHEIKAVIMPIRPRGE